ALTANHCLARRTSRSKSASRGSSAPAPKALSVLIKRLRSCLSRASASRSGWPGKSTSGVQAVAAFLALRSSLDFPPAPLARNRSYCRPFPGAASSIGDGEKMAAELAQQRKALPCGERKLNKALPCGERKLNKYADRVLGGKRLANGNHFAMRHALA